MEPERLKEINELILETETKCNALLMDFYNENINPYILSLKKECRCDISRSTHPDKFIDITHIKG